MQDNIFFTCIRKKIWKQENYFSNNLYKTKKEVSFILFINQCLLCPPTHTVYCNFTI
ncbi:hypothetical protein E2C01_052454 [Portunus trituberculatus]|uniref:Uncharacterized protein n=1 Tax=Portunus trituberculatus TaxID=210409 RepID=A0A5B7GLL8_PORTR|nr:hypothetical protein [Portunus trituberculatus]